ALVTARPGRARAALGAWLWSLWRLPSLVAARRHVARFRRVRDREVRRYQVRGLVGPRLRLLRVGGDGRAGAVPGSGSRRVAAVPVRGRMGTDPAAWSPGTALVATALAAVALVGSRHLLTRAAPGVGEVVPPGGGPGGRLADRGAGGRRGHAVARRRARPARHAGGRPPGPRPHAGDGRARAARHRRRPPAGGADRLEVGPGRGGGGLRGAAPPVRRL